MPIHCNWLVGLEAQWDPTHVPILHRSSLNPAAPVAGTVLNIPPYVFEVDRAPYGTRMSQSYGVPDGMQAIRMKEYLFPFFRMNPQTPDSDSDIVIFGMVPTDDDHMMFWFILYNHDHAPSHVGYPVQDRGPTGIREMPYGADANWGQDRAAMAHHFTGLALDEPTLGVVIEDLAMLESMSETLDRTRHHLAPSDAMLTKCRHLVKTFLEEYEQGQPPPDHSTIGELRPRFLVIPETDSWRDHYPAGDAKIRAGAADRRAGS